MRPIAMSAVTAVLAALMLSIGLGAEPASSVLTIRLYNSSGVSAPKLVAARHAAESILHDAGLDVIFRYCGLRVSPEEALDTCNDRLKSSEVVVRVISAPAFSTSLQPEAYGVAYVVEETGRGWLATVFSDRIDEASTRAGVEAGVLLGRVMAHEIGHLLLGRGYHGEAGVMRAEWPDALLTHADGEWRFSKLEAARMQHLFAIPF